VSAHEVIDRSFGSLTDSEYDLLCRAVAAEAGGQTLECQIAVAETILNRIDSTKFPNTLREVIYAPGQFEIVDNGSINRKIPNAKTIQAVETALKTRTLPDNVLYFNSIGYFSWVIPYERIDDMYFSSIGNNAVKRQICINEITFYGSKKNIEKLKSLLEKDFKSQNRFGKTWYGNYLKEIGLQASSNGYINSIGTMDIQDGQYYLPIKTYTENDVNEEFLNKLSAYFQINYCYMSTNPSSKENIIKDKDHLFYKYNYLLVISTSKTELAKYLKTKEDTINYINDKFYQNFETLNDAEAYIESLSEKDGVSVIYKPCQEYL